MQRDIDQLRNLVWRFRHRYELWFKTPLPIEALHFAQEEIGEARRAMIRATTSGWNRNNNEGATMNDVLNELTDVLIMVLSADPERIPYYIRRTREPSISSVGFLIYMAGTKMEEGEYDTNLIDLAVSELYDLLRDSEITVQDRMIKTLRKIYEKRIRTSAQEHVLKDVMELSWRTLLRDSDDPIKREELISGYKQIMEKFSEVQFNLKEERQCDQAM